MNKEQEFESLKRKIQKYKYHDKIDCNKKWIELHDRQLVTEIV